MRIKLGTKGQTSHLFLHTNQGVSIPWWEAGQHVKTLAKSLHH